MHCLLLNYEERHLKFGEKQISGENYKNFWYIFALQSSLSIQRLGHLKKKKKKKKNLLNPLFFRK